LASGSSFTVTGVVLGRVIPPELWRQRETDMDYSSLTSSFMRPDKVK